MGLGLDARAGASREDDLKCLLDTHFLIWLITGSSRLKVFPWLEGYRPWTLSPVSLLELKFLAEVGRLQLEAEAFMTNIKSDSRFQLDDIPLHSLVVHALALEWTRDPFDRLLVAHSLARRTPLCTVDRNILQFHSLVPKELAE